MEREDVEGGGASRYHFALFPGLSVFGLVGDVLEKHLDE